MIVETAFGTLTIEWSRMGLVSITFGVFQRSVSGSHAFGAPYVEEPAARKFLYDLERYFSGDHIVLDPPIVLPPSSSRFQRQVWETTREVPYGEVRTYSWLAERISRPKAARSVGTALGQNPIPLVVPCHRIMRKGGRLGGFAGGLEWKQALLELEGA